MTVQDKDGLRTLVGSNIEDNNVKSITPEELREVHNNTIDSVAFFHKLAAIPTATADSPEFVQLTTDAKLYVKKSDISGYDAIGADAGLIDNLVTFTSNNANLTVGNYERALAATANDTVTIPAYNEIGEEGAFFNATGEELVLVKDSGDAYLGAVSTVIPANTGFAYRFVSANTISVVGTGDIASGQDLTDNLVTFTSNTVTLTAGNHDRADTTSGAILADTVSIPAFSSIGDTGSFYNATGVKLALVKDAGDSYLGSPAVEIPNDTGFFWRFVDTNVVEVVGTGDILTGGSSLTDNLVTFTTNNTALTALNSDIADGTSGAVASDSVTLPTAPTVGEYGQFFNATGVELALVKDAGDSYLGDVSTVIPDDTGFHWRCVSANTIMVVGTGEIFKETLYGDEQVVVIEDPFVEWDWTQNRNYLFTTTDQDDIDVEYPTGIQQGHQVSVVFQSSNPTGTNYRFNTSIIDVDGNTLPDLVLANGEAKRIIFGTTNALFVAALDYPNAVQGLQATKIDSSAGATTETLTASTNQGAVRLFTNIDVTNTATLTVAVGETLNGVTDGTFLFSNYSADTQFRADETVGGWVVSVAGASTQTDLHKTRIIKFGPNSATEIPGITISTTPPSSVFYNAVRPQVIGFFDVGDEQYNIGLTIGSDEVTINKTGHYRIVFGFAPDAQGSGGTDRTYMQIVSNNTNILEEALFGESQAGNHCDLKSLEWEGELQAGDIITLHAQNSAINRVVVLELTIAEHPTTQSVLAGMVTPETLHLLSFATDPTISNSVSIPRTNNYIDLDDADWSRTYDPDSMVVLDATGDYVEIQQNGRYAIDISVSGGSIGNFELYINGSAEVRGVSASNSPGVLFWKGQLIIGDKIQIHSTQNIGRSSFTVEQLPSSTVVMPDALDVEDINETIFDTTSLATGTTTVLDNGKTWQEAQQEYDRIRVIVRSSNERNTWSDEVDISDTDFVSGAAYLYLKDNGAATADPSILVFDGDANGSFRWDFSSTMFVKIIGVKAQKTVINTTDTPVSDQTASGYMDIGNMRMQWGRFTTSTAIATLTFPAPFADGNASVTGNIANASSARIISFGNVTTADCDVAAYQPATFNIESHEISWQAIGLKP